MKSTILFILSVMVMAKGWAQVVLENNPPSIRFDQINTENFRIIFPKGFDSQAQRMANTLEVIRSAETKSLKSEPRRLTVVLQNQSSISNGFVTILPRRSEFFTMPPQDYNFVGNNDWLNLLATHEYRHVVQYQHATRGFNKFVYYLFGNMTLAGFSQAAVPQWFWEGDAVVTETALTPGGRGRIPNFGLVFRTNLLEGRRFNYHKQYLRSYKHNIPDHYVLGYYMVSYLRMTENDPEIWSKITARSWSVPFIPFTFSNSIKKETGRYVTQLYNEMADSLTHVWREEVAKIRLTDFETVNSRKTKAYTDYLYPQPLGKDCVIVMKRGIGDIERFVIIDKNKKEHKVFTPGLVNDAGMLSVNGGAITWSEYRYHSRFPVKNFSVLKVYKLNSKELHIIGGKKTRLSGTTLSPDGRTVAAVESNSDYEVSLQLFDVSTGKHIKTFPNPDQSFISMPRFSEDGQEIVVVKTNASRKRITIIDVKDGSQEDVLDVGNENVGHPILYKDYILFNSPVTGIDNIFAYDVNKKVRLQASSSKYGAYNPAVSEDGSTLYYNEQTANGLDVVRIPFDPTAWQEYNQSASVNNSIADALTEQEGRPDLLRNVPNIQYPVTHYSKLKGIINPYSWGAFVTNDLAQINVGVASRDILSTTAVSVGYLYDLNEGTSSWSGGLSYQALFPILDINVRAGKRENGETLGRHKADFSWREFTAEGGIRIPFTLTSSKYVRQLDIGNNVGFTRTYDFRNRVTRDGQLIYDGAARSIPAFDTLQFIYKDQLNNGDLIYNHASLSFVNVLKRSRRDFLPRWGQTLNADFYNTPYGGDFKADQVAVRATLYFPGLFKHHFLYGRFGFQDRFQGIEENTHLFRNMIARPRGHSYPGDETFFAVSANYTLPLWYPDIALGPILNIQRIKANFFYDYGKGTGNTYYYSPDSNRVYVSSTDEVYQSAGVETTFDFNVMRFLPKFEVGFRTVYRFANQYNTSGVVFEAVIGNIAF